MFPVAAIPIIITYNIYGSWLSSFWKCFSFLSRSSVTCEACRIFFKGICSKLAQKRDNAAKEWEVGWGCAKASWKDPPRICWIKSLHLDIIVLLLCWELPLPQGDQISGWKMVTCQDTQPHLVSYIYQDKTLSLHSWLMIILSSGSDKYTILNCWDDEREIKIQQ